jgi:hypothetical protein
MPTNTALWPALLDGAIGLRGFVQIPAKIITMIQEDVYPSL